jgi:RimJ/RimL family protein N-acetyltransferase
MSLPVSSQFTMRPMTLDDIETVAVWLQDVDDLSLFDRNMAVPPSQDTVRDSWKADLAIAKFPSAYWFVVESYDREPVAIGGLQSVNYVHGDAVLPILVSKAARGKGLGLRAAMILLDLAFDRLRLRRVTTFFRSDGPSASPGAWDSSRRAGCAKPGLRTDGFSTAWWSACSGTNGTPAGRRSAPSSTIPSLSF